MAIAAERAPLSQETEKMVDSVRASKGKKHKDRTASRESVAGERKTRKKAIAERDGSHKHSKSTRKRHHALLKLKLKQRKRVSEARLESYGLVS